MPDPAAPPPPPSRWGRLGRLPWAEVGVATTVFLGLVVRRQVTAPEWEPRGADWGMWYSSAAWFSHDVVWPPVRWPLWGFCAALFDRMLPGPLHVDAMVLSMACAAVAAAATFAVVRGIAGRGAGLAAGLLFALHPMTLEMGGWLGAYALWAACAPVAAAGLAAAVRSGRPHGWWVAGSAIGTALAVQDKGLLTAGGLAPAVLLALVAAPGALRVRLRTALPGLLLPGMILAAGYIAFPEPLASLDAQLQLQVAGVRDLGAATGSAGGAAPAGEGAILARHTDTPGWIFGRQMGPSTLLGLTRLGLTHPSDSVRSDHRSKLRIVLADAFPGADPRVLTGVAGISALALLGALVRAVRRAGADATVAVLALLGVVASGIPALDSDFNLRFELASAWAVPALVGLGAAAVGSALDTLLAVIRRADGRRWARSAVPLALAGAILGPGRKASTWQWDTSPLLRPAQGIDRVPAKVWFDLQARWPDVPVDVVMPFDGGALAIDGRDGRYLAGPDLAENPAAADHWLIVTAAARPDGASVGLAGDVLGLASARGGPVALGARRIAAVWPRDGSSALYLLTPDPPPVTPG